MNKKLTRTQLAGCAVLVATAIFTTYQFGIFSTISPNELNGCVSPNHSSKDKNLSILYKGSSDHTKPFILSNEVHRDITSAILGKTQAKNNSIHIGFSCWANYDTIALRKSSGAVLADRSNLVHDFHETTKNKILESENRTQFIHKITTFLKENRNFLRNENPIPIIEKELFREGSWLSNDQSFEKIKSLYQNKRIFHIRMDITDSCAFSQISAWLKRNGFYCDSLDISNIPDWLNQDQISLLGEAIPKIFSSGTYILHSSLKFSEKNQIEQKVFQYYGHFDPTCLQSGNCSKD